MCLIALVVYACLFQKEKALETELRMAMAPVDLSKEFLSEKHKRFTATCMADIIRSSN